MAELFAQGEDGLWSDMCQNVIDQLRILFEENGVKQSLGRDVRLQIEETIHFLAAEGPIHPLLLKWHPKPKTICLPLNAAMMPYILKMEKYTENAEQATLANNRTATKRWRNKADKVMDAIIQILEA